jgi:Na+/H+ antiporter, bacterial form
MEIFFTILIMTLVVSLSGVAARILPFQIPLPLVQIAAGALLAWPTFGLHVDFDPELFLVLFIPPLLFADGWKTPINEFLHHGREIIGLALVLVLITVVGIGYLIYWLVPGIPLIPAFALAAVLSPTDAVALSGIVGEGRIPKKIMSIVQGEALMNDASGLVSLKFAVAVAMGTMVFTWGGASVEFLKVAIGGLVAGVAVCWLYGRSLRLLSRWSGDDPATQTVLLLLLPFASYLIAEHLGVSGILAAVAAGMTITRSGIIRQAPLAMRLRANSVWQMLEFVFNGMVFLMLGLQLPDILSTSIAQANADPNVELWMLFADVGLVYAALMIVRFGWLWIMKRTSLRLLKKKPLEFSSYSLRELLIASFAWRARCYHAGRCAVDSAVPQQRRTFSGALRTGVYRHRRDSVLAVCRRDSAADSAARHGEPRQSGAPSRNPERACRDGRRGDRKPAQNGAATGKRR